MSQRSPRANSAILLVWFVAVTLLLGMLALDTEMPGLIRLALALLWAALALPTLYLLRWLHRMGGDRSNVTEPPARSAVDDGTGR
ncbi:hypothetical protein [Micromonospora sp. NPDC048839]|uniref:hypothetical protein n=1 Tax=Micromonospora sp. NPDC048839 TaxID=3155641 RepID=UPI0033C44C0F